MNIKQLFSLALLVSALVVAPSFAMDAGDANAQQPDPNQQQQQQQQQQQDAPKGSWCPFAKLKDAPVFSEVYGLKDFSNVPGNYFRFVKSLVLDNPVKTFVTLLLAKNIYDNVDNIKAALGLGQDEEDVDAQVFADAKCGCTDEQAEEEEVVEVCELDKKDTKKANA